MATIARKSHALKICVNLPTSRLLESVPSFSSLSALFPSPQLRPSPLSSLMPRLSAFLRQLQLPTPTTARESCACISNLASWPFRAFLPFFKAKRRKSRKGLGP
jgi:hypothetical protein